VTPGIPSAEGVVQRVRCGDCRYFARDGKCTFLASEEGRKSGSPFEHAPFWVWSDCYSDREQVRADVRTLCPTFEAKRAPSHAA
jgi:hypothetical protein